MDRIGIESLTCFAIPPVDLVHLAADLDCQYISIGPAPFSANPEGFPPWSLRDPATHRATKAALAERGVSISLGGGFAIIPGRDSDDLSGDLDLMCELGVRRIITLGLDPHLGRVVDQVARLAEMAADAGVEVVLEFVPTHVVGDLPMAIDVVKAIGRPNLRLLIDSMHLIRSGGTAAAVAEIDPALIGYAQLCDASIVPSNPDYAEEVVTERMVPGTGELPLTDIVAALPLDIVIGLEIPLLARALAGEGPKARAADCVAGARRILSHL